MTMETVSYFISSRSSANPRWPQRGFTLIEVMISVLILAIGLLGVASMQTRSLQMNQSAQFSSQASILAYDIIDRMRANRGAALSGDYNRALGDAVPGGATPTTRDLREWLLLMQGEGDAQGVLPQLGGGLTGGAIDVDNNGNATVTIAWFDARWEEGDDRIRNMTVTVEL